MWTSVGETEREDRRTAYRVPVAYLATLHVSGNDDRRSVRVADLSAAGVGFVASGPLVPGTPIALHLEADAPGSPVWLSGRVVRSEPAFTGSFTIGCRIE